MYTSLLKKVVLTLACAGTLLAQAPAPLVQGDKSVVVMPLRYSYQVVQDYYYEYERAQASLKGYAHESASASYRESSRDGVYSSNTQASARESFNGQYDLKAKSETERHARTDRTIVEKSINSEKLTGIIESSLSEAGVRLGTRNPEYSNAKTSEEAAKKAIAKKAGDYVLTGDITSLRVGGVRRVPDGTNRRYSVDATCKISIKISRASDGSSTFARTFTGKGSKTFDAVDYIPSEDAIEMAVDDVARQITAAVLGKRIASSSESDDEYADSPGKRLRE